jgi:hypothetical protein
MIRPARIVTRGGTMWAGVTAPRGIRELAVDDLLYDNRFHDVWRSSADVQRDREFANAGRAWLPNFCCAASFTRKLEHSDPAAQEHSDPAGDVAPEDRRS